MAKYSENKSSKKYLDQRRRIKNKEHRLELRLKSIAKEDSKEKIKKSCRIGRKKEGFTVEEFKKNKKRIKEQ